MKKGFTLIELLGVLILLAVIALITIPIIDKVLSNVKNEAYERQKDSILSAARLYVTENGKYNTKQKIIKFQTLIDLGYLKEGEILDPRNSNKEMSGCVKYYWNETANQYIFEYSEECVVITPTKCFTYENYENGIEITDYDISCGSDVAIPNNIDGKKVLSIGRHTFANYDLTSVIIPDGVQIIGGYSFRSNNLKSITIPNSVKEIGKRAFDANQLTSLDLSNLINIQIIYNDSFRCNSITFENFIGINEYNFDYFDFSCIDE